VHFTETMSDPMDDLARLEALTQSNYEEDPPSEAELRLLALGFSGSQAGAPRGGAIDVDSGGVSEDFVELSIPGYDGSTPGGSSQSRGASPMMSTTSAASGASRGGGFGRSTGKEFGVVMIVRDESVCLGDIGDGAKFCLKIGCSVSSHKTAKKFDPSAMGSLVIARSQDVAFAAPVLGGDVLPSVVRDQWCMETKPLEEWNQLFKVATQVEPFSSLAEYEEVVKTQQTFETFKSPVKKKLAGSAAMSGRHTTSRYAQAIDPTKKESFTRANPGRVADVVMGLDSAMFDLSASFLTHVRETQDAIAGLEISGGMLEMSKDTTSGLLGSINLMASSSFQNPTVFGTMAALGRKIEEMSLAGPPLVDFSPIIAEVEKFKVETKKVQKLSIDLTVTLSNKVKALEAWKRTGPQTFQSVYNPAPVAPPPVVPVTQQTSNSSVAFLARLEALELEVNSHQIEIQRLIAEGDETAIKFAGLGLKSIEETGAWVDMNSPMGALDFSLIPDVYFILDLLAEDGEASQSNMLQTMNRLRTLNLDSEYQAKALAAFQLEVPRFFHGSKDVGGYSSGSGESQLANLPNVKAWNQGQGSKKKLLERKLPGIRQSFRNLINNSLMSSNPKVYSIAIEALERSISWIINLASWIDRAYENAHIASRMSEVKSWALVTQLVRRVFAEIFVVRMGTVQAMGGDRKTMCTGVLWSVFRTHDKMAEFDDVNFEDHPAISSEHIKFLATNSGFDMLATLEKEVACLKCETKETALKVTAASRKADAASTVSDLNKKAIAELVKKVDKKVDR
jgi:hypothetical protein